MVLPTPLHPLSHIGAKLGINLWVKRDDLYPLTGGGNKGRKTAWILKSAQSDIFDAVVTNGGIQSNHARAVALAAAERGWRCKLVLHGEPAALENPEGNLRLSLLTGAEVAIVTPDNIAESIADALKALKLAGHKPLEIAGGGHCIAGAEAYADAVHELSSQCSATGWWPQWIVHASGTGTTQAGIIVGTERAGWDVRVVGISVARRNPRGRDIVAQACSELRAYLSVGGTCQDIDFRDDWVEDGYERASSKVIETIYMVGQSDGLILDPTYTGKAFTAIRDLVRTGEIPVGANVLFWHTGGLPNLMASGYFSRKVRNCQ